MITKQDMKGETMKSIIHAEETTQGCIAVRFDDGGRTTINGSNLKLLNFTSNSVTVKDHSVTKRYVLNSVGQWVGTIL